MFKIIVLIAAILSEQPGMSATQIIGSYTSLAACEVNKKTLMASEVPAGAAEVGAACVEIPLTVVKKSV